MFFFVSQISERGRICRISTNPCDFTEFCDGISEFCLNDITSADFETCNNKTAFCYQGKCRDPDRQCVELFGKCISFFWALFLNGIFLKLVVHTIKSVPQ